MDAHRRWGEGGEDVWDPIRSPLGYHTWHADGSDPVPCQAAQDGRWPGGWSKCRGSSGRGSILLRGDRAFTEYILQQSSFLHERMVSVSHRSCKRTVQRSLLLGRSHYHSAQRCIFDMPRKLTNRGSSAALTFCEVPDTHSPCFVEQNRLTGWRFAKEPVDIYCLKAGTQAAVPRN
jgi:hypothetical protein